MSEVLSVYALGNTDAEHERLARQAAIYDPLTERLFREAGIGTGQRVLDIGSGAGDVALLLARLVGPSGTVVGLERSRDSINRARSRVADAGLTNVTFIESDVGQIPAGDPFDAAVGRLILMFLPEPVSVVRPLSKAVRPGGVVAFHEPSWVLMLERSQNLPLCVAALSVLRGSLERTGANPEMGFELYNVFQKAGLPAPKMRLEVPVADHAGFARWVGDTVLSVRPYIDKLGLSSQALGDLSTLGARLHEEVTASDSAVAWLALVGAWAPVEVTL
ncbi:MAG: methylase [Candidatus Eremiobacter antarcticus]|nr:class I SAM-dependent methyltransferase [Candidatus Eremiobacteraeota bacterium]MBC5807218.1 class I SAM-dependent methyltransferase [Candidatus Eremiobacteraeota bacterium]PZR61901.1 MAG: methylase [Candidatus Eremiobacter sp. RRmetagenome_bin22]